MIRSL